MAIIRPMVEADIPEVHSVWKEVNFFLGTHTIETYLRVDPHGLYVAVEDGAIVGMCATIFQNEDLAVVGLYGVKPTHQGRGIGWQVWKKSTAHAGSRNCFLYATQERFEMYRDKAGYTFVDGYNAVMWYKNKLTACELVKNITGVGIEPINKRNVEQVIAYDEDIVGYNRSKIISNTMDEKDCVSLVAIRGCAVCGYGCLKDEILGSKLLGPLYAESLDVAELILHSLLEMMPFSKECGLTYLGIDANPLSAHLAKILGLELRSIYPRMYNKAILGAKFEKVYSVFDASFCSL